MARLDPPLMKRADMVIHRYDIITWTRLYWKRWMDSGVATLRCGIITLLHQTLYG